MLLQAAVLLAISASVIAHPHAGKHRHPLKPSGSGNIVAPTGGMYGMGNGTAGYGPTGSGFLTGTSVRAGSVPQTSVDNNSAPTGTAPDSALDTVVNSASDLPAGVGGCMAGSRSSTTTIYSTEMVTLTVYDEDTTTVLSSATIADVASESGSFDVTSTSTDNSETSAAAASSSTSSSDQSTVDVLGTTEAQTPTDILSVSSVTLISADETTTSTASADAMTEYPSATSTSTTTLDVTAESPAASSTSNSSPENTDASPAASSEESSSTSTTNSPGAFYEAPNSSPTPITPLAPSVGSYGNGKRGLAYNSAQLTSAFAGSSMSWAYNWAAGPDGTLGSGIEFVPMLWGQKTFSGWEAAAQAAIAAGATNMLSFNEPDLSAQANMDSATAAAAHIKYMNPYSGQVRIGSPAVTNGGPSGGTDGMGLGWMRNFFDKCAGKCKVDFLAFHWYDSADNVAYFKNYVQDVITLAKENGINKVWMTEFAASGSNDQVAKFLDEVLPWMDGIDAVERYAYFMCSEGQLVSGSSMSDPVGKAYAA